MTFGTLAMSHTRAHAFILPLLVVCASTARAADEPFIPPNGNVSLFAGVALREQHTLLLAPGELFGADQLTTSPVNILGFSPTVLRLRADWWFAKFVGIEADVAADFYATRPRPADGMAMAAEGQDPRVRNHARVDARLGFGVRYISDFGLILHSGAAFAISRVPYLKWNGTTLSDGAAFFNFGPVLRAGAQFYVSKLELSAAFNAYIGFRGTGMLILEPTASVGWRFIELNELGLSLAFDYAFLSDREFSPTQFFASTHRFQLGVRASFRPAKPKVVAPVLPETPTTVRLAVTLANGSAASGAMVTLDGVAPEAVDAKGERVMTVTPGAHELKVTLTGYRVATSSVNASKGVETRAVVELQPLTGPGKLSGVVIAASSKNPVGGANVSVGENSTQTDEKGAYTFAAVGPGPVKVRVEAQGFNQADEVAQVPPEGEATLDVTLEALGKGSPATVRGLIRSRTGEAVKANVVIKGVNKKVPVNAEGRFVVTIPGGDYFFVISAPGYVSQTKKVTLADGDQAIFHCELQKVTK